MSRLVRFVDPRHWLRTILHLDDSPHSIALGTAIGLFVGLTPTVGIQMAMVLVIAVATRWLFRFNRIAALLAVYVSNPLTMVPIYWYTYKVGTLFFAETTSWDEFKKLFRYHNFSEWWHSLKALFINVGMPLVVGSVVVGLIVAVISYPIMYVLARQVQERRHEHHLQHRDSPRR